MKTGHKITYESFTERVAKRANVSDAEADAYIHQLSRTATDALEENDEVQLYHFGRFRPVHVDERSGTNPNTGEALTVPAHTRVDFQPYSALLLAVNFPFRHLRTRMLTKPEDDDRPSILLWALLALMLLVLLLSGIGLYNWMSGPGELAAAPAATPAETPTEAPAAIEAEPLTVTQSPAGERAEGDTGTAPSARPVATDRIRIADGDTLSGIAQSRWGAASWWPVIYAHNRANLPERNPDLIQTGSFLRMPVLEGSVTRPTDADLMKKADGFRIVAGDYERTNNLRAAEYRRFVNREFGGL